MRPLVLLIVLAVVVLGATGCSCLASSRPIRRRVPVAHTLPNDRFGTH